MINQGGYIQHLCALLCAQMMHHLTSKSEVTYTLNALVLYTLDHAL